jgi:hypothetical protein
MISHTTSLWSQACNHPIRKIDLFFMKICHYIFALYVLYILFMIASVKSHLQEYFPRVRNGIDKILTRHENTEIFHDILDSESDREYVAKFLKMKQRQMKYGEIWQMVIGEYPDFENLYSGHSSGLDILSHKRKLIMELKNRYNSDNHSSRKANWDKLIQFQKLHPEYACVYGIVNDKTSEGSIKVVQYCDTEITYYSGKKLFEFIFGDDADTIVEFVKHTVREIDHKLQEPTVPWTNLP